MPARKSRGRKPNATGRSNTDRFVRLPHLILNSCAYRSLSLKARCLLVELGMLYNGSNNGGIFLSVEDAKCRLGLGDHHTVTAAFNELQELGFITKTAEAHFHVKTSETSRARTWRLNWEAGPGRKGPSMDFLAHEAEPKTTARARMERGMRALKKFRKAKAEGKMPVVESTILTPDTHASGGGIHHVQS